MARIIGVGTAVPGYVVDQATARDLAAQYFKRYLPFIDRLKVVFDHAAIDKRHSVVPVEWFSPEHQNLKARNDVYLREATALGQKAIEQALAAANLTPQAVDNLIVVSSTGIATPSLDAHLMNLMKMRSEVRRTPIWGLGCAGGVAGLARAAEMAQVYPQSVTVLLAVETCSLTFQLQDTSKKNFISTAIFADGAAAVAIAGEERVEPGPEILASQSTLWPESLDVMGWDVVDTGLAVIFGIEIPNLVIRQMRPEVDCFLGKHGLRLDQIAHMVLHPGGSKVIDAYEQALGLVNGHSKPARETLRQYGNMSSPTVLFVLDYIMKHSRPQPGDYGLVAALGPGFSAEQVLIRF